MGIEDILFFIAGLGIFMIGLSMMGDYMESAAGNGLRRLMNRIGNNNVLSIGIGAGATIITQSSSATTVMVVGLANAGIITLAQGTAVMLGASIGTTITPFLANIKFLSAIFPALCAVGVFITLFSKSNKVKSVASIISALGMIFAGLKVMSLGMSDLKEIPEVLAFFSRETNPFLMFAVSLILTMLIQSSAATIVILTTILTSMGANVGMSFYAITAVVLGANIGTCITAILGAIGTNVNGKRAALIHLVFKVIGTIVFALLIMIIPLGQWLEVLIPDIGLRVTTIHIIFNLFNALLMSPFINWLVSVSKVIIKDQVKEDEKVTRYIDNRLLKTPTIAITQTRKELEYMSCLAKDNFILAYNMLLEGKTRNMEEFDSREKTIDELNGLITQFLVNISSSDISYYDEKVVASFYKVVTDVERIGDYAENLTEYADSINKSGVVLSDVAKEEIENMCNLIVAQMNDVIDAFSNQTLANANIIASREDEIDHCSIYYVDAHIDRLKDSKCSPLANAMYLSTISNLERVGDHLNNIFTGLSKYIVNKTVIK